MRLHKQTPETGLGAEVYHQASLLIDAHAGWVERTWHEVAHKKGTSLFIEFQVYCKCFVWCMYIFFLLFFYHITKLYYHNTVTTPQIYVAKKFKSNKAFFALFCLHNPMNIPILLVIYCTFVLVLLKVIR